MKKFILILLIFISSISFGQMKHRVVNNEIVQSGLPEVFTRPNGELFLGSYNTRTDLHTQDGWVDEVIPEYNQYTHKLDDIYYSQALGVVTYNVIPKTQQEIDQENEAILRSIEFNFDQQAAKRLLGLLAKHLLEDTAITEGVLSDLSAVYYPYKVGVSYSTGDVFTYEGSIYSVIQPHVSQTGWKPNTEKALYKSYAPQGTTPDFIQPTGAHDTYKIGDKVKFNGQIYESLINNNSWSPSAYPQGWKKL